MIPYALILKTLGIALPIFALWGYIANARATIETLEANEVRYAAYKNNAESTILDLTEENANRADQIKAYQREKATHVRRVAALNLKLANILARPDVEGWANVALPSAAIEWLRSIETSDYNEGDKAPTPSGTNDGNPRTRSNREDERRFAVVWGKRSASFESLQRR